MPTLRFLRDKIARHTSTATDELVEALKPFAVKVESGAGDDKPCLVPCKIGDVRRACTLLTKLREGKGG